MGGAFQILKMKRVLEMDSHGGCMIGMYLISIDCTLKNGYMLNIMLHAFYLSKKNLSHHQTTHPPKKGKKHRSYESPEAEPMFCGRGVSPLTPTANSPRNLQGI